MEVFTCDKAVYMIRETEIDVFGSVYKQAEVTSSFVHLVLYLNRSFVVNLSFN